jgi:hypothetical protein
MLYRSSGEQLPHARQGPPLQLTRKIDKISPFDGIFRSHEVSLGWVDIIVLIEGSAEMADELTVYDYEKIPISRIEPGEIGVLLARAGVGKTACLTHVALAYLLGGESVLHVCVDLVPDKVKAWYHKLLKDIFANQPQCDLPGLEHDVERRRFIMSFLNQTFSPEKLEMGIENLKQQADFEPSLIILDGMDFGRARPLFERIGDLARKIQASVWVAARAHRHIPDVNERGIPYPIDSMDDLFSSVFMLEQDHGCVRLRALKEKNNYTATASGSMLDPDTFLQKTHLA